MKLKKLLAAVTAAALAVTTMAVTSFTASAAALSTVPEGTETVLYNVDLSGGKSEFTSAWDNGDWTQVNIDEADRATIMSDSNVYVKATMSNLGSVSTDDGDVDFDTLMSWGWAGYNWVTGLKWYNNSDEGADFECNLIPLPTSTANSAVAYAPISDLKMYDWGGIAGNLQSGNFSSLTVDSLQIVKFATGDDSSNTPENPDEGEDNPIVTPPTGDSAYALLWEGSTAQGTSWVWNPVNVPAASVAEGDTIKITFTIDGDDSYHQVKIMDSDNNVFSSVTEAHPEYGTVDVNSPTYSFVVNAADAAKITANGMTLTGYDITITKVELNPDKKPSGGEHTHTPASEWSKDGTNHWHACSGCDEKLDLAAHIYVDGACSVCGAADPNAGSTPTPSAPTYAPPAPNPAPVTSTTVVDTILAVPDGGNGSINLGSSTKLDRLAMDALSTKGDVTVKFTVAGGAYWEINGNNITEAKAVDLGVKVNSTLIPESKVNEFAGDKTTVQLTLRHNGDFGFTGTLNVPVGKANNGKFANLYYYHGGKFDFVGSSAISGGMTKFAFSHASNYLIVIDDYAYGEDVSSAACMTETTTSAVPYAAAVVIIAAFGTSAIVLKKRLSK
ncbi:MAG: hypothetical protein K2G04_01015 [Oscillospiraceae bacterium]|nr:hypothetical protein [Oscillospiraceae bacterium]